MTGERAIERIDLNVLLTCLNALEGLQITSITKSEKPDFILTSADVIIGVEHTRAVYQEVVLAGKLHHTDCPNLPTDLTDLRDRQVRRSNEEILASMLNLSGSWKKSEERKLEWKDKIASRLMSKREKLNQCDYQIFDENWLLIHDYPPLPAWPDTQDWAGQYLRAVFFEKSSVSRDFDTVFVHSGQYLFRWHKQELDLADIKRIRQLTLVETDSAA